ncbi:Oleoyl-acyl carrier protein thioesterase [Zea mays]|uniref:Oleoyl-acyl carrier protein thioesterase n=1 Tax=Zea mays TaxID=4577 RepID=A0A1D6ESQ9_MAIZE|nr:Oleoyl-acyl carrier protein thioesterase [Zea mays]
MHRVQRLPRSILLSTASRSFSLSSFLSPRAPGPPPATVPGPSSYRLGSARLPAANPSPLRPCKTPTAHRRRRRLRRRPGNEPPRNDAPALPHAALSRATAMRPRAAPPPRKVGVVSRTRGGGAVHAGCAAGIRDRGGVAGPRSCHGGGG